MKKSTIAIVILLIALSSQISAQVIISGSVYDSQTKEALQYCNISIAGKNQGCITNEDGNFKIKTNDTDAVIVISYLSYKTQKIKVSNFRKNQKIFLQQDSYLLAETDIIAYDDYLYEMIADCSKKNKKIPEQYGKAYFSLETTADKSPIEVIECYYNSRLNKNNPETLILKNGRIALAPMSGFYFVSLSTGNILTSYNIFENPDRFLNLNPLQMRKQSMKKKYNLDVISVSGENREIYQIGFKPKKIESNLFEGEIWINKSNNNILRLVVTDNDMIAHPFSPLSPDHRIDSIKLSISYNFSTDSLQSRPELIQFDYSFNYIDNVSVKRIHSNGILYFFKNDELFYSPRFSHVQYLSKSLDTGNITWFVNGNESKFVYSNEIETYTDYDKIVSMPYNDFFWKHNDAIMISDKKKSYLDFFKQNGVLLNYNELSVWAIDCFHEKKLSWSESKRLSSEAINGKDDFKLNYGNEFNGYTTTSFDDFYNLKGQIFMDVNQFGDSISVLTSTLIDLDESYYYLKKEAYTDCFINNYYDLIELQRRNMNVDLNKKDYTVNQIDSVYNTHVFRLNEIQTQYLKECERGSQTEELEKWTKLIEKSMGINNSLLFNDSICGNRLRSELSGDKESAAIEKYNTASALYSLGKYKEAKELFLDAVSEGDTHPWLFYNLALTYHKLDDLENACKFIKLSETQGEKLNPSILQILCE